MSILHLCVEVQVGELEFGNPVLVVERDRRTVFRGLPVRIDTDIIPEDLTGLLLGLHKRGAGECDECRIGEGCSHVQGKGIVLGPVGFIGNDDDIRPVGEFRVRFVLSRS